VWPDKTSPAGQLYAYRKDAILTRGQRGLAKLYGRPENLIFVVSHSGFLRLGVVGWWFFNSDYRIFHFTGDMPDLTIEQDESTLAGGLGLSWKIRVELGFELPEEDPENGEAIASRE
jgi:broad specificity phosphatase PhoE